MKYLRVSFLSLVLLFLLKAGNCTYAQDAVPYRGEEKLSDSSLLLLVFFTPDCPLCQNYTKTIKALNAEYGKRLRICIIFPGYTSNSLELISFQEEYLFKLPCIGDRTKDYSKALGISVTPEVVLLSGDLKVLYRGAIDNWMYAPGKKRQVINKHYLKDAVEQSIGLRKVELNYTKAFGCVIRYDK